MHSSYKLTPYPHGSIREILTISLPLIIATLSVNCMSFLDRILLAQYSISAMNAQVSAITSIGLFQFATISIASISEVFVGHYNGSNREKHAAQVVWQMLWFSLFSSLIFWPAAFCGPILIPAPLQEEGIPFLKCLMLIGPLFPLNAALGAFFIGRGHVRVVMVTSLIGNCSNLILDYLLIFGIGSIPALGTLGAGIATGIAQAIQTLILFKLFLSKANRINLGTSAFSFNKPLFNNILRLGLPNAIASLIEYGAWTTLIHILTKASHNHLTVFSICESFYILFAFGIWGIQKGVLTITANLLGANLLSAVHTTIMSGIKLIFALVLILSIPMIILPKILLGLFTEDITPDLIAAMRWVWLYFFLDGINLLFHAVLTAAGHTAFVMVINSIGAWLFYIYPLYWSTVLYNSNPSTSWLIAVFYGLLCMCCYAIKYRHIFKTNDIKVLPA